MTVQRPNAFVSQEFETLEVVAVAPDLDSLVVGPCYQVLDYLDDKADCKSSDYGALNANNVAIFANIEPAAVLIATPPNVTPGATLIGDFVKIFLDNCRACVVYHDSGAMLGNGVYSLGNNLFSGDDGNCTGIHLGNEEVAIGDILIANSPGANDYVKTVREICQTLIFPAFAAWTDIIPGDKVKLFTDSDGRDGTYTVKRIYLDSLVRLCVEINEMPDSFTGHSVVSTSTVLILDSTETVIKHASAPAQPAGDWCNVRVTSDFVTNSPGPPCYWRIERLIHDVELSSSDFTVDPITRQTTLDAAIKVDLSDTLLDKSVMFGNIYMQYMAWRNDLARIWEFNSADEITAKLGKFDARNPLCVGTIVSKGNTTTRVKAYGLPYGDGIEANQYSTFLEDIGSQRKIYSIVPLTYNQSVLSMCDLDAVNQADPVYVLDHGIHQKFRAILGALYLRTQIMIGEEMSSGTTSKEPFDVSTRTRKLNPVFAPLPAVPPVDFVAANVLPGDKITMIDSTGPTTYGPYTVSHLNGVYGFHVEEDLPVGLPPVFAAVGDTFEITSPTGASKFLYTVVFAASFTPTPAMDGKKWRDLTDTTATFISDGVIPGDVLQIPGDPNSSGFKPVSSFTIDQVLSETRVRIMDNGWNTSTVENELPHDYKRTLTGPLPGSVVAVTQGSVHYRVMRNMTKSEQVDYLLQITAGLADKRLVLCYPGRVDIEGLVDGSLPRNGGTTALSADPQPGYYLACAVSGQTAGQPSHQGFTNMAINMITRVYDSWDYFSEEQISDLSNGGVYVFVQDNPESAPYTIHEVTSDVSSLQFAEYMILKNFDFIAWMHLDAIFPFIGVWNVNEEAIGAIMLACTTIEGNLMTRRYPRIGAPLLSAKIRNVGVNSNSSDRIDAFVNVTIPMVLNTVGVHLIA